MGICYINKTIEIPIQGASRAISLTPEINGDSARTAGGTLRFDVSTNAVKENWNLQTELLTETEFNAIYDYLVSINFGFTDFWLNTFGGTAATNSITAKVTITNIQRAKTPDIRYGLSINAIEQ